MLVVLVGGRSLVVWSGCSPEDVVTGKLWKKRGRLKRTDRTTTNEMSVLDRRRALVMRNLSGRHTARKRSTVTATTIQMLAVCTMQVATQMLLATPSRRRLVRYPEQVE